MIVRVLAVCVLLASLGAVLGDQVTSARVAEQQAVLLEQEIRGIDSSLGLRPTRTETLHKARLASVTVTYENPPNGARLIDSIRLMLRSRGWNPCGRSIARDIYGQRPQIGHEIYCLGDMRADVAWPDGPVPEKDKTYTLTLEWNQMTAVWWITNVALLWAAGLSALILVRGNPPSPPLWLAKRRSIVLSTALSPEECRKRLSKAGEQGFVLRFANGDTEKAFTAFTLERRRSLLAANAVAPYFYGCLQPRSDRGEAALAGHYGFHPIAKATAIVIGVLGIPLAAAALWAEPRSVLSSGILLFCIAVVIIAASVWMRRREEAAITKFLTNVLSAT